MTRTEQVALLADRLDGHLPRMAFRQYGQFYNDDPDFDIEAYYRRVALDWSSADGHRFVRQDPDSAGRRAARRLTRCRARSAGHDRDIRMPSARKRTPGNISVDVR